MVEKNTKSEDKNLVDVPLTCPNCGFTGFTILHDYLHHEDEIEEVAECIECHERTYVRALKHEYHDDKGEDFEIAWQQKLKITYECQECLKQYEDNKIYLETYYDDTNYSDIDPEPKWNCPEHQNAGFTLLMSEVDCK